MWFIYFNNSNRDIHYGAGPFASAEYAINYAKSLSKNAKELGVVMEDYDNGEYMTLDNI